MTVRLVALMSVVLLLSLAAFGLLINHHQDRVMAEVARTASEVGRATLRTLEFGPGAETGDGPATAGPTHYAWSVATTSEVGDETFVDHELRVLPAGETGPGRVVRRVIRPAGAGGGDGEKVEGGMILVQQVSGQLALDEAFMTCPDEPAAEGDGAAITRTCETILSDEDGETTSNIFISIEGVRAETDPTDGIVLTIPRWLSKAPGMLDEELVVSQPSAGDSPAGADEEALLAGFAGQGFEELRLPIPVGDYRTLYASLRDRSIFVFFGVFLLGTALTAGVASRFTRPVRLLDAGIRRLSEGDLDVRVETRGRDEVARLGTAFNEMARSLRANRERSRELVRREKLSALGGLAAGVAHDVRNPLHSIGLTLQHLRDACRPEDEARAEEFEGSIEIIRGEVKRLDRLVGNFLQFARSDRRVRRPVDLRELLRETANLVRKEAEWRKVDLELCVDETAPSLEGDAEAIRSSVLNLVLNSFEAMPEGGRLTLGLKVEEGELRVEVADTGRGIPAEDRERVFDFSFTTREGGHGLGLAMVHQCVVEEHGGRVDLNSCPGEGTRVGLSFPLDPADSHGEA